LSNPGKSCSSPVDNKKACLKASWYFNQTKPYPFVFTFEFVEDLKGDGYDLPKGCVTDAVQLHTYTEVTYVYWNPKGVALSSDQRIKQVCFRSI
jgi:hypothetical protein